MEGIEINGKIDLGVRRLIVAHVENAITFYGYVEEDKDYMDEIKQLGASLCNNKPNLTEDPKEEQMVCFFNKSDNSWYRGRVEQLNMGKNKNEFRVRTVDFGWNGLYKLDDMVDCPEALKEREAKLEKYKFVDLRAKGRDHGYTADDRQRGGNWLKKTIGNRIVVASCYKQKNYAGGIMADCMVGETNLNKASLSQGHAVFAPSLMAGYMKRGPQMKPMRPQSAPFPHGGMGNGFGRQMMNGNGGKKKPQDKRDNKKKTNLDQGIKDLSKLLDRVNQARGQNPDKEAKGNNIVNCLVGVSQTIEEVSEVTEKYMAGIEAVKNVQESESGDVNKAEMKKCINQYRDLYSEQVVEDEISRVANQLTAMQSSIPNGWKLPNLKVETITRANMMEVSDSVKNWIEGSVSKEAELTANSKKEMESYCRSLDLLSRSLAARDGGELAAEIPTSMDSQLGSLRQALSSELSCRNGPKITDNGNANNKKKNPNTEDAAKVLRSAWKALNALKGQLEIAKTKANEFDSLLSA